MSITVRSRFRFALVPADLIEDERTGVYEIAAYCGLAKYANQEGTCFPSMRTLAELLGMSRNRLREAAGALRSYGYLEMVSRRGKDGGQTSYLFTLLPGVGHPMTGGGSPREGGVGHGVTPNNTNGTRPKNKDGQAELDRDFVEFWEEYPRKVKKKIALAKYRAAIKGGVPHEAIMFGLHKYVGELKRTKTAKEFVAHPSTWLHGAQWEDEISGGVEGVEKKEVSTCPECGAAAIGTMSFCPKCGLDRDEWKQYKGEK